jgi:hypothetical protein
MCLPIAFQPFRIFTYFYNKNSSNSSFQEQTAADLTNCKPDIEQSL